MDRTGATRDYGRIVVRTDTGVRVPEPGTHRLELDDAGEALLHVPDRGASGDPAPLVVMFHGAGADAGQSVRLLAPSAERHGTLVLAPSSTDRTWDLLMGGWSHDVALTERALDRVLADYAVDRERIAVGGFSDGASYALSLGFTNGGAFSHILAFSPGFMAPAQLEDRPACFVSHGVDDRVLPIDRCSRRLVPALEASGYEVRYEEFDGGHEVPRRIVDDALRWLVAGV